MDYGIWIECLRGLVLRNGFHPQLPAPNFVSRSLGIQFCEKSCVDSQGGRV